MKNEETARQMINLHKSSFDNSISAIVLFQDQTENPLNRRFSSSYQKNTDENKARMNKTLIDDDRGVKYC